MAPARTCRDSWQVDLQAKLAEVHEHGRQKDGDCRPATAIFTIHLFENRSGAFFLVVQLPAGSILRVGPAPGRPPEQREIQVEGTVDLVIGPVSCGEIKVGFCKDQLFVRHRRWRRSWCRPAGNLCAPRGADHQFDKRQHRPAPAGPTHGKPQDHHLKKRHGTSTLTPGLPDLHRQVGDLHDGRGQARGHTGRRGSRLTTASAVR